VSGSAQTRLSGLSRSSEALRFAHPSNWHPPARLGSGPVRTLRLLLARHRRLLGACLALAGLGITIRAAAPPPPATVPVLVAARDLPAGQMLTGEDLRTGTWPADQAPSGRLTAATGRQLASPIRTGELVTDARVVGPGLLAGQAPGTVAMPIRLGDPAAGTLVRAGDRVDVLTSSSSPWSSSSAWSSPATSSSEPDLADGTDPDSAHPDSANSDSPHPGAVNPDSANPDSVNPDSPDRGGGDSRSAGGHSTNSSASDGGRAAERGAAERVVAGALVLAVPGSASDHDDGGPGSSGTGLGGLGGMGGVGGGNLPGTASGEGSAGLLVLAVSSAEAARLAALQASRYLGIAVLPQQDR
jgi:hypothetical protein